MGNKGGYQLNHTQNKRFTLRYEMSVHSCLTCSTGLTLPLLLPRLERGVFSKPRPTSTENEKQQFATLMWGKK